MADALTDGREAFGREEWADAYEHLATRVDELDAADVERLAMAAHLIGKTAESEEQLARAHRLYLEEAKADAAARAAFWLGFKLMIGGEHARGSGWLARAERVLEDAGLESVVEGFLLLPRALGMLSQGAANESLEAFQRATDIGIRFENPDLTALGRLGQGQSLIRLGKDASGVRLLDEVMVAVTAGEVSPVAAGVAYCGVLSACHDTFDLRRAQEWTAAFSRWCAARPDLVPFRGECLTYRAEIKQVHGDWSGAMEEAQRAGEWLTQPPGQRAAGAAFYRQAELHRLRGEFDEALRAYREAERWGRTPHPGLALLQVAEDKIQAAVSGIRKAVDKARDRRNQSILLAAAVDVHLAAGDASAAREAGDNLAGRADEIGAPYLTALSQRAEGALQLHAGRCEDALDVLRRALTIWRELDAPYEAACTQILIARACRALGDPQSCKIELDEARRTFEHLNARPNLDALDALTTDSTAPGGLTPREIEVLELVATGKTNRAIADDLFISEKTVARHVSNIFLKLDVSSRAAATAYAYEHGLV